MPATEEDFTPSFLLARLGYKSARAREWAASRLAATGGPAELEAAAERAARESDDDVLMALLPWLGSAPPALLARLIELARLLLRSGRERQGRELLLRLLPRAPDDASRRSILEPLVGEEPARRLLELRSACGRPELFAGLQALRAERGAEELGDALAQLLPREGRLGVHWALGVGSLWGDAEPDRWEGLAAFLPAAAERAPGPAAAPEDPTAALERLAARERQARWDCPALAAPPLDAALESARRAALAHAELLQALADALRWSAGRLPELEGLGARLRAAVDEGEGLEQSRRGLARARDPWEAAQVLLALPIRAEELDGLAAAVPGVRELEDFLAAAPPGRARRRVLSLLARRGLDAAPGVARHLGDEDPDTREAAFARLAAMGPAVLERLESLLDAEQPPARLLDLFARFPGERSSRMLAARAGRLFARLPQEDVAGALAACGGLAAAEALADAYRPGEPLLARALAAVNELHGRAPLILQQALRDLKLARERERRLFKRMRSAAGLEEVLSGRGGEPLTVALRCRGCRYEYNYEVERVVIATGFLEDSGPSPACVSFERLIVCKRCGALEDYELGLRTMIVLAAELARLDALPDDAAEEASSPDSDGRLLLVKGLTAAGREFGSQGAALRHLEDAARQAPGDASIHKRLGNCYRRGGLGGRARQSYERALSLDPAEMEAHYNLGRLHLEARSWQAAHRHLRLTLESARNPSFPDAQRRELARAAFDGLLELQARAGLRAFPGSPASRPGLPGRGISLRLDSLDLDRDEDVDRVIALFAGG